LLLHGLNLRRPGLHVMLAHDARWSCAVTGQCGGGLVRAEGGVAPGAQLAAPRCRLLCLLLPGLHLLLQPLLGNAQAQLVQLLLQVRYL
jgi:hypothetical protein